MARFATPKHENGYGAKTGSLFLPFPQAGEEISRRLRRIFTLKSTAGDDTGLDWIRKAASHGNIQAKPIWENRRAARQTLDC
jgi:hypothetical protein